MFDCYDVFRTIVDPRWYFTLKAFAVRGKDLGSALAEQGYPPQWLSCVPDEGAAWRILRSQQPGCLINDIFHRYLVMTISDPEDEQAPATTVGGSDETKAE